MAISVRRRKGIQSVEIAFQILEKLRDERSPQSLSRLSKQCGMTASRLHFYLVSLTRVGLVAQSAAGGEYRLGPAAIRLGLAALSQLDILNLAREEMAPLSAGTKNTIFLSVWNSNGPTVINRFDGEKIAPMEIRVGAVLPLLTSATGKAFLAWLPAQTTASLVNKELQAARGRKRPSLAMAKAMIREIRAHGFSAIGGMVVAGVYAVAAPVFDRDGALRCVLTIIDDDRENPLAMAAAARLLTETARAISLNAGFEPVKEPAAAAKNTKVTPRLL